MTSIKPFFEDLVLQLNTDKIEYSICGNYEHLPDLTSNDIDIWVDSHNAAYDALCATAKKNSYILYLSNKTANGSNNFFYKRAESELLFLHVDLLTECAWLSVFSLVDAEIFVKNRKVYKNFIVNEQSLDAALHLIYPLLQWGRVIDKYHQDFLEQLESNLFTQIVFSALGTLHGNRIIELIKREQWIEIEALVPTYRKHVILKCLGNINFKTIGLWFQFFLSIFRRCTKPPGLFIALIGPDGAGKTTILAQLKGAMSCLFPKGKFKQYYWRPFLLPELNRIVPIRRSLTSNGAECNSYIDRKNQINNSLLFRILYIIKFLYYTTDFILGFISILPAKARGGIICFDRYYYDQLVYPERFGFHVPLGLMNFVENFIYRPDLVFLLNPPTEVLLARKQEIPLDELRRQQTHYEEIIRHIDQQSIDSSSSSFITQSEILEKCLEYMSTRYTHG